MRYLLLTVPDDKTAGALTGIITATVPGAVVTEHGPGCCCKNCPWDGDHGEGGHDDRD